MNRWTKGRTALVGDAAACVSLLAGEGTGLAMAEAYALAGELHHAGNDYRTAFARYQERMRPFLKRKQERASVLVILPQQFDERDGLGTGVAFRASSLEAGTPIDTATAIS